MKRKIIIACSALISVMTAVALFVYYSNRENRPQKSTDSYAGTSVAHVEKIPEEQPPQKKKEAPPNLAEIKKESQENVASVESIKQQLYNYNIEYTDDLEYLDDMVQPSAANPPALWSGDWVSADDWKRYDDTFKIEKDESGNYRFIPESDGAKSYSYDKEKKEFVWEMNYYGKIITSKARFITDNVMVLTKISGEKAAVDIYHRDQKPAGP
jgi:hypothetical protein